MENNHRGRHLSRAMSTNVLMRINETEKDKNFLERLIDYFLKQENNNED